MPEHLAHHLAAVEAAPRARGHPTRLGSRPDMPACPLGGQDELRGHPATTRREVLEAPAPSRPPVICLGACVGSVPAVPATPHTNHVLSWLPGGRTRYDYPRTMDDWVKGHTSLHTRCSHLFRAGDGAAALDELHEILFGALSALPPKVEEKRHQKLTKRLKKLEEF